MAPRLFLVLATALVLAGCSGAAALSPGGAAARPTDTPKSATSGQPGSSAQVIGTIPDFFWELSLGIYLMVKGFKPSPITEGLPAAATV